MSFVSPVTNVLYTAVSWVLLRWHQLFGALGMDENGGLTWALSIVFLVITARLLLFRMFIKQVHYQRHMQELQPQIQKLREKYKGDRTRLNQEMMKLQQEQGFNPLAGCAPLVLQIPVFLGLFHVLRHLAHSVGAASGSRQATLYGFSSSETLSAAKARLFGDAPLAASFHDSAQKIATLEGERGTTQLVIALLTVVSAGATFLTQRQAARNATTTPTGQAATIQKVMQYLVPLFVLGSGFIFSFPLGVIIYWFTSNLWTMAQQFYIYKFHPHKPADKPAEPTNELGRSLAPAPGAKPVRKRSSTASVVPDRPVPADTPVPKDVPSAAARSTKPRPGSRPGGNKPAAKRSGQRSKRR